MKRNIPPNLFLAYMTQAELQAVQKSLRQELGNLHDNLLNYKCKRNARWRLSDKADSGTTKNFEALNEWNDLIRKLKKEIAIKSKLSRMLKAASK